ncbi:hypothetical protein PG997_009969 [Apiospora hydei]|uniref:BZIP domain-containing protein n=1 Tax=Apiospora hydei TaxID=1337664 RepID=A0ABR1VY78_9PEZI
MTRASGTWTRPMTPPQMHGGFVQQAQHSPSSVSTGPPYGPPVAHLMGGQNQLETFPAFDPLGMQPPASPLIDSRKAKESDSTQPNPPGGSDPSAPGPPTSSRFQASTRSPKWYPLFPDAYTDPKDPNESGGTDPRKPLSAATPLLPPIPPFGPRERPLDDETSDVVGLKRARNTLAARKSRERKARQIEELKEKIARLEREREHWTEVAMSKSEQEPHKSSSASKAGGT